MEHGQAFCAACGKTVEYTVREARLEGRIRGKVLTYTGKQAICPVCGSKLETDDLRTSNQEALTAAYRRINGIIPLETIRGIPEKYAIGKRPLSLLLGWGEQTFSRYYEGDLPTKQYSDVLIRIDQDPGYYLELLEAGKENLRSPSAYKKSKRKVESLLAAGSEEDSSEIFLAVRYLLNQCEDITPMALQKALYYIQGFYYAFYGEYLFEEDCEAWAHGPVYRNVYNRYQNYRYDLEASEPIDDEKLGAQKKVLYDSVVTHICCYSGKVLERFTQNEMPWLSVRGSKPGYASSDSLIPKESIGEYFSAVKAKYNMVNPNDIRNYTQAMMQVM